MVRKLFFVKRPRAPLASAAFRQRGFSLIELTILLAIASIIAVGMMMWVTPPSIEESEKIRVTLHRLRVIDHALLAFRVNNKRLPCPAQRSLPDDNPLAGEENCEGVDAAVEDIEEGTAPGGGTVAIGNVHAACKDAFGATPKNIGVVPVRALGLEQEYMLDGWGRRFTYHVAESLCDVTDLRDSDPTTYADAVPDVGCSITQYDMGSAGNIEIRTSEYDGATAETYKPLTTQAAYVLFSHGPNGDCAWLPGGTQRGRVTEADNSWMSAYVGTGAGNDAETRAQGEGENIYMQDSIYWKDKLTASFDDFLTYRTKEQIEFLVMDPEAKPDGVTPEFCTLVSENLEAMTQAENTWLNDSANEWDQVYDPTTDADVAGRSVLLMMWYMQELCAAYFPSFYVADTDRRCPGSRIYIPAEERCRCDASTGNPDWNDTTGTCEP